MLIYPYRIENYTFLKFICSNSDIYLLNHKTVLTILYTFMRVCVGLCVCVCVCVCIYIYIYIYICIY